MVMISPLSRVGLDSKCWVVPLPNDGKISNSSFKVNAALGELLSKCHVVTPIHLDVPLSPDVVLTDESVSDVGRKERLTGRWLAESELGLFECTWAVKETASGCVRIAMKQPVYILYWVMFSAGRPFTRDHLRHFLSWWAKGVQSPATCIGKKSVPWNHFNKGDWIPTDSSVYAKQTSKHLLNWRRTIGYFCSYLSKCRGIYHTLLLWTSHVFSFIFAWGGLGGNVC